MTAKLVALLLTDKRPASAYIRCAMSHLSSCRRRGFTLIESLAGLLFLLTMSTSAATLYVNVNNSGSKSPYSDWATAATNIQDAVDTASAGDTIVVTNGIFKGGHRTLPTDGASGKKSVVGSPAFTRSEPAEAGTRRPTLSAPICGFGFNRVIAEAVNNDFRADLAAGVGWRVPVGSHCQVA